MNWLVCLISGFILSVILEIFLKPDRPATQRPAASWFAHIGLWFSLYGGILLFAGSPTLSLGFGLTFLSVLVIVSNAKYASLYEPFTYQDFRYLTDALRYPRLYFPFLGSTKAILILICAAIALTIAIMMGPITVNDDRPGSRVIGGAILFIGLLLLSLIRKWWQPTLSFDAAMDIQKYGFWTSLWLCQFALRSFPQITSPFDALKKPKVMPDMIAIQSESFFDPRILFSGIKPDLLASFDRLTTNSTYAGELIVPAWGANTVRTEFAFLSGLDEATLRAHRYNPYESIARGWPVKSVASYLKELGYRTVCIHPYHISFYRRNKVFPLIGFDELIGIDAFKRSDYCGAYVGDIALTETIIEVLAAHKAKITSQPIYVFVITMENHGPLHLEKVQSNEIQSFYTEGLPLGCGELSVYLKHLRNSDLMMGRLERHLNQQNRNTSLCWYGDHVPIMPAVYKIFGHNPQNTNYFIWQTDELRGAMTQSKMNIEAFKLGPLWLKNSLMGSQNT